MPRSMTGYGSARATGPRIAVEAEVRSVNGRSLKVNLKAPSSLSSREPDLVALVRKRLSRGSVTLSLRIDLVRPQDAIRVRSDIVEAVAAALEKLRRKGLVQGALTADAVPHLPGAIEKASEESLKPADFKVVREAVEGALSGLDTMRRREGAHLVRELKTILRRVGAALKKVERRAPAVVEEYRVRLRQRVDALLAGSGAVLDENTLAREVALLAERSDVAEETARLHAHLAEFAGYLEREGAVGRTLDFLAQEMLRETNTIGSKSNDVAIARAVIAMKGDVDRLKEQVANLE